MISQLDENTFLNLEHLRDISVHQNELEALPGALFDNNKDLEFINFSRNKLVNIPAKLFVHPKIEFVLLSSNVCIDKSYRRTENYFSIAEVIGNDLAACNH